MTERNAVVLIIIAASLVRIVFAAMVGLGVDESYIAGVSRQFALSYFDHPPLHIWLVGGWAKLVGSENPLLLRLPFIALFAVSTWLMFRLTALAYGDRAGLWAALALNLAPIFSLSSGSWILPDGPLLLFALISAWFVARIVLVEPAPPRPLLGWLAAGLAGGLALLSKYLAIFLFAGVGLFLLTSRAHRRMLGTAGPWLGLLVAALIFSPVLIWNMTHQWASFAFQGRRGLPAGMDLNWLVQDIGGQFLYLLPWIAVPLIYVLVRALLAGPKERAGWFFACLSIGPIAVFALLGFVAQVLPHWPSIGWLFVFPLLGDLLARLASTHGRALRWTAATTAAFLLALLGAVASHAMTGWIGRAVPELAANDPMLELLDWRELKPALESRGLVQPGTVIATVNWIDAGKVNLALGGEMPVLCLSRDARQFAFLHDEGKFVGRDAIIVANATNDEWLKISGRRFQRVEPLADIVLTRSGQPAITLHVARGFGLRVRP